MTSAVVSSSREASFGFHAYDLSSGFVRKYSGFLPLDHGTTVPAVYHAAVVVFGWEYFFEGGVSRRPAGCTRFGTKYVYISSPKFTTQKSRAEFEAWVESKELDGTFGHLAYRLIANNCHAFCEMACQFLTDGRAHIPHDVACNVQKLTAFPLGDVVRSVLERLAGGGVVEVQKAIEVGLDSIRTTRERTHRALSALGTTLMVLGVDRPPPAAIFLPFAAAKAASGPQPVSHVKRMLRVLLPYVAVAVRAALERREPAPLDADISRAIRQTLAAATSVLKDPVSSELHPCAAALLCDALACALGKRISPADISSSASDSGPDAPSVSSVLHGGQPAPPPNEPFAEHLSSVELAGHGGEHTHAHSSNIERHSRVPGQSYGVSPRSRVRLLEAVSARTVYVSDTSSLCDVLGVWLHLQCNMDFAITVAHHIPLLSSLCDHLLEPSVVGLWPSNVLSMLIDLVNTMMLYPVAGSYLKRYPAGIIALLQAGLFARSWAIVDKASGMFNNYVLLCRHFSMSSLSMEASKSISVLPVLRAAAVVRIALRAVFPPVERLVEQPADFVEPNHPTRRELVECRLRYASKLTPEDCAALIESEQSALSKLLLGLVHLFAESAIAIHLIDRRYRLPAPAVWSTRAQCAEPLNHDLLTLLDYFVAEESVDSPVLQDESGAPG